MSYQTFGARSRVATPARELWDWHMRPGALERLIPPWERVEVLGAAPEGVEEGSAVTLRVGVGPFRKRWVAVHRNVDPGRSFQDVQQRGPFAHWVHTHRVEPAGEAEAWLDDRVEYALPYGVFGRALAGRWTRNALRRTFTYRHAVTAADLRRRREAGNTRPLDVAISGASGLVGRSVAAFLQTAGHRVRRLVRRPPASGAEVHWDPSRGRIDVDGLRGLDAVVHLAGENIGARWTEARKAKIRESRVEGTRLLAETLAGLDGPPAVLVAASAIGYYGDRGDEPLDEDSPPGHGFLAETCKAWEAATGPAERKGIRVVRLRIGVVLSPAGGALAKMLPLFRLGLGGRLGHGRQYQSWIGHSDLIGIIHFALVRDELRGAVNAVSPLPVTNAEFTRTLGRVLRRPTPFPAPAAMIRLALGEQGQELLLAGAKIRPSRLEAAGFRFHHPDLEGALRFELGRFDDGFPRPEMRP